MRHFFIAFTLGIFVCRCAPGPPSEDDRRRPNILVILADDLGYTDLGILGSEIRTPNLDRLAREGMLLTNFLVSPTCSPTRAMLLTGVDSHLAGMGTMFGIADANQAGQPGYEGVLNDRVVTFPTLLRDSGYRTYMVGKWHLGMEEHQGPHRRGFERSFALLPGGASHFNDAENLTEMDAPAPYREDGREVLLPKDFYSSDFYTDKLIEYIQGGLGTDQPFFAFAAYTSPHWPLHVPDEYLNKYQGVYDQGYDALRARRFENAKQEGLISPTAKLPARIEFERSWDSLSEEERKVSARTMEIYAAMVENLDDNIGRLIEFLRQSGQLENTFALFLPDNGPEGNPLAHIVDPDGWLERRFDNSYDNMGRINSYVYYSPGWAQAVVAPFRLFKTFPTEGGVRVPAIVRFPDQNHDGERSDSVATIKDVAPTILELAGVELPGTIFQGREIAPIEGTSMLPFLTGRSVSIHDDQNFVMGWELFGRRAIRRGPWKLTWFFEPYGRERWELFNVSTDVAESRDLSEGEVEIKQELHALWEEYVARNGVIVPTRDMSYAREPAAE